MQNIMTEKLPFSNRGAKMPNRTNYIIGLDWIELTGTLFFDEFNANGFLFEAKQNDRGSMYFKETYSINTIYENKSELFGVLEIRPRVSFIDQNIVKFKLNNKFCYHPNYLELIKLFLNEFNITFKNYTRLDVFLDFQHIQEYSEIQNFLSDISNRKLIVKNKQNMSIYYNREFDKITGISLGSRKSTAYINIYNKTIEMKQKTNKPYISDQWQANHFDINIDTYRLEISMKKNTKKYISDDSEIIFDYSQIDFIKEHEKFLIKQINEHFQIAYNENNGERFSRQKPYRPFDLENIFYIKIKSEKESSSNYTKAYIKKILKDSLIHSFQKQHIQAHYLINHALYTINLHGLDEWFKKQNFQINRLINNDTICFYLNMN